MYFNDYGQKSIQSSVSFLGSLIPITKTSEGNVQATIIYSGILKNSVNS